MDISNTVGQWLLGQLQELPVQVLRQGAELRALERMVERILGAREAEEIHALLNRPRAGKDRKATVFLPGAMGSLLASIRGISALLWFNPTVLSNGHLNLLDLNQEGTGDRSPEVEIIPVGIEKLTYLKLILTLARESRLYEFPYDWRRHLEWNANLLHESLVRWSLPDPERRFTLIGHSLGGMLARTYLALYPQEAEMLIDRVIMLGSPLFGTALTTLLFSDETPHAQVISLLNPNNDTLEFSANLPVSYQLLPPPPELFPGDRPYPVNWDLYDALAWGLPGVRQDYLNDARRLYELLSDSDPQVEIIDIAGCHKRTLTDVWRAFDMGDGQKSSKPHYTLVNQERGGDSGDGTVPLWSTHMDGVKTYYVEERHSSLPGNRTVLDAVLELVYDGAPALPDALPEPSSLLRRIREIPIAQQVTELRQHIESGKFTREDLERLFFFRGG